MKTKSIKKANPRYEMLESLKNELLKTIHESQWERVFFLRSPTDKEIDNRNYFFDEDYINTGVFYERHIAKYVRLCHLNNVLSNGLYFQEPSEWKDDFEKRFYCADYSQIIPKQFIDKYTPKLYACCFTYGFETEAAWNTYKETNNNQNEHSYQNRQKELEEKVVRLEINRYVLLSELNKWAKNNDFHVYDGYVDYTYPLHKLKTIHKSEQRENPLWFEDFSLRNYLSLLLQKRRAYYNEMEERIFLIPNRYQFFDKSKSVKLDFAKIINKLILSPNCNSQDVLFVENLCLKFGIKPNVCKSELNKSISEESSQIVIEKPSLTNPWSKHNVSSTVPK